MRIEWQNSTPRFVSSPEQIKIWNIIFLVWKSSSQPVVFIVALSYHCATTGLYIVINQYYVITGEKQKQRKPVVIPQLYLVSELCKMLCRASTTPADIQTRLLILLYLIRSLNVMFCLVLFYYFVWLSICLKFILNSTFNLICILNFVDIEAHQV